MVVVEVEEVDVEVVSLICAKSRDSCLHTFRTLGMFFFVLPFLTILIFFMVYSTNYNYHSGGGGDWDQGDEGWGSRRVSDPRYVFFFLY